MNDKKRGRLRLKPKEQREQRVNVLHYAESRLRKTESQILQKI